MRDRSIMTIGFLFLFALHSTAIDGPRVSPQAPPNNPEIGGKTLDEWIKLIEDRDPSVRENAIRMVGQLGGAAKRAVPALTRQLATPNDLSPLASAIVAIGLIVPDDAEHVKKVVTALLPLLGHDQHIIRYQAAMTAGNIGPAARATIDRLTPMIKSPHSWELRRAAAFALGRVGRDDMNFPDMRALKALVDGIDDPHCREVRIEALKGIIDLGPPPQPQHQSELRHMLEQRIKADKDKVAGIWVRVALLRMDAGANSNIFINDIAKNLKSNDLSLAADAARGLGACGVLAKSKIPDLIEAMKSSDVTLTYWCAWALGRMGPDASAALPALNALLQSADANVKSAAQEAMKEINTPKK